MISARDLHACGGRPIAADPRPIVVILVAVLAAARPAGVRADMRSPSVLNPKTYRSPAGAHALTVDPTDMTGKDKATYRLSRGEHVVWEKELPFTLWDAAVTDDGLAGGYAYSDGYDALVGDLRIVLLDPRGNVRVDHAVPRAFTGALHAPAAPVGAGLFLDPPNERMVVRLYDPAGGREHWWTYRLSDGAAAGRLRPRAVIGENSSASVIAARPVTGTPLTLVNWFVSDYAAADRRSGAQFALLDRRGRTVWHLDLPGDYGDADTARRLWRESAGAGSILRTDQPGRFDVWFVAAGARITFAVAADPAGGWAVREVGRAPYAPPAPPQVAEPVIPVTPLKPLRSARLVADRPRPAVRDVAGFCVDGRGRLAFLRREEPGTVSLIVVEPTGQMVAEVGLTAAAMRKYDRLPRLAWVGGDRFVVVHSDWRTDRAEAWWVDVAAKEVSAVVGFDCQEGKALAGSGDGGFVALASWSEKLVGGGYTPRSAVHRFDAAGRRTWTISADYTLEPGGLFSPTDVAVTTTGRVAVLDVIRRNVSVFDPAGKYERVIDLSAALGREPNYPCRLVADVEGGLVVEDFRGKSPILRLRADGTVRSQLAARFADGRTSAGLQSVRVAPDGRLWTTDGYALLRLAADGTVDGVVGDPPDPAALGDVAALAVDGRGGVYAVDARTATVHAFDAAGRPVRQFRPHPIDFEIGMRSVVLSVGGGEVFLGDSLETRRLHFAADGTRVGWEPNLFDQVSESWHFDPGGTRSWVRTYHDVRLVEGGRSVVRTITRRPDGNWLECPDAVVVAADGSAAVSSRPADPAAEGPLVINLYAKDGAPVRTVTLPPPVRRHDAFAYGGGRLAVGTTAGVVLFDATCRPLGRFTPSEAGGDPRRHLFILNSGNELLVFDDRRTVTWYEMP
jgi:hypothetical protein